MMHRRDWCGLVAALCAPGMVADATESLWIMLPALQHFPDTCFTPDSAQQVATRDYATPELRPNQPVQEKRSVGPIPAFDEISRALNAYRKTYVYEPRPALPAPSEPDWRPPTQDEIDAVTATLGAWKRDMAARKVAHAEGRDPDDESHLPPGLRTKPAYVRKASPDLEFERRKAMRDHELLRRSREARGLPAPPLPDILRDQEQPDPWN